MHPITRTVLGDPVTVTVDTPDDGPLRIMFTPADAYDVTDPEVSVSLETTTTRTDDGTITLPAQPLREAFPRDLLDNLLNETINQRKRSGLVYRYMSKHGFDEDLIREYVRVVGSHGEGRINPDDDTVIFNRKKRHPATRIQASYTGNAVRTAGPLEVEMDASHAYEHVVVAGVYAFDEAELTRGDTGRVVFSVPRS